MSLTVAGLTDLGSGQGVTPHYSFSYDVSLLPEGAGYTSGLMLKAEEDFALMQYWFDGADIPFDYPLGVQVNTSTNAAGAGTWNDPSPAGMFFGSGSFIQLDPGVPEAGTPLSKTDFLRYLLVSEVTEMLMKQIDNGWYEDDGLFQGGDEGSMGEGLSRFLAAQFLLHNGLGETMPAYFAVTPSWLKAGRPNNITNAPDDHGADAVTGCATAFLWYLHSQLNFSISQIINAGSFNDLNSVYGNLTGDADGWHPFINLLNLHYPPGESYNPKGDNLFPVCNLVSFSVPHSITYGYHDYAEIKVDHRAKAEIYIALTSSNPGLLPVPGQAVIKVGDNSVKIKLPVAGERLPCANKSVKLSATYAGVTKTGTVRLVSPKVVGVSVVAGSVICGDISHGEVTVDKAPTDGSATIQLSCSHPNIVSFTPAVVSASQTKARFQINTVEIPAGFPPKTIKITARFGGATQTTSFKYVSPTVSQISFQPNPVLCGGDCTLIIYLTRQSNIGPVPVNLVWTPPGFAGTTGVANMPAGSNQGPFAVSVPGVIAPFAPFQGQLSASCAGIVVTETLTVQPAPGNGVLSTLTIDPPVVVGGQTSVGLLTLVNPVASDTIVGIQAAPGLHLVRGETPPPTPPLEVPAFVTVLANQPSQPFNIPTNAWGEPYTISIVAQAFVTAVASLQVNPRA